MDVGIDSVDDSVDVGIDCVDDTVDEVNSVVGSIDDEVDCKSTKLSYVSNSNESGDTDDLEKQLLC